MEINWIVFSFSSFISAFWDTVIAFLFVGLTILDAIFVTSGFSRWCSSVSQRFSSCEAGQGILHITQDNQEINTTNFFIQMGTVQVNFQFSCKNILSIFTFLFLSFSILVWYLDIVRFLGSSIGSGWTKVIHLS